MLDATLLQLRLYCTHTWCYATEISVHLTSCGTTCKMGAGNLFWSPLQFLQFSSLPCVFSCCAPMRKSQALLISRTFWRTNCSSLTGGCPQNQPTWPSQWDCQKIQNAHGPRLQLYFDEKKIWSAAREKAKQKGYYIYKRQRIYLTNLFTSGAIHQWRIFSEIPVSSTFSLSFKAGNNSGRMTRVNDSWEGDLLSSSLLESSGWATARHHSFSAHKTVRAWMQNRLH